MNAMRLTGSAPSLRQHTITAPVPAWRHPSHVVLETCVEDVEGVRISARVGADRAELGANLTAAGTTPSIGTIEAAIFAAAEQVEQRRAQAGAHWAEKPEAAAPFGLRILIRPRGGSFVYNADEGRAMIADVRRIATLALEMAEFTRPQATGGGRTTLPPAVDLGFVVGALTEDGTIDRGLVRLLVDMANGAPVTFHRAFDQCRDTVEAYGDLEGLGVRYVLTSGAAQTAADGASVIAGLVASGGPTVVAAGAVRPDGLVDLVESTGVREVHMRCPREGLTPWCAAPSRRSARCRFPRSSAAPPVPASTPSDGGAEAGCASLATLGAHPAWRPCHPPRPLVPGPGSSVAGESSRFVDIYSPASDRRSRRLRHARSAIGRTTDASPMLTPIFCLRLTP